MSTMDEFVGAAMERISHWKGEAGAVNVAIAIRAELRNTFKAGRINAAKEILDEIKYDTEGYETEAILDMVMFRLSDIVDPFAQNINSTNKMEVPPYDIDEAFRGRR